MSVEEENSKMGDTPRLTPPVGAADHVRGSALAPITLVAYGDYVSAGSHKAHAVIEEVRERLGDELRFVFRNFPLPGDDRAFLLAEAAEAAGAQGRFWWMHDALYARVSAPDAAQLEALVRELGLNLDAFNRALRNHTFTNRIRADVRSAQESGARQVPALFVNRIPYEGRLDAGYLTLAIQRMMGP